MEAPQGTRKPSSGLGMGAKLGIVAALVVVIAIAVIAKSGQSESAEPQAPATAPAAKVAAATPAQETPKAALPKLIDLGATKCIPCKMMAPILEELKKEYAGKMDVEFIDVWVNKGMSEAYGVSTIPTQIFYDVSGKEVFRHIGFFAKEDILAKWKELGVDMSAPGAVQPISRLEPLKPDTRDKQNICYMCDGDVPAKTRVTYKTDKGDVSLCSPHCYFILYSSLTDKTGVNERISVTDWATGQKVAATTASYLIGTDERHRPVVKAFATKETAANEMKTAGGDPATWQVLEEKELTNRCCFCDRAIYPSDAAAVQVAGIHTWGCCPMCAMGVAARLKKNITVEQPDALTGEMIRVATLGDSVSKLEPKTAVAWAGMRQGPDGKLVSTGCFKQAFFANDANLKKWLEQHPTATGKQITINQALADKMNLSEDQIAKACKIGECSPK